MCKDPKKKQAYNREWRLRPEVQARQRLQKRSRRLGRYGITQIEFEALLNEQGGICAVCGTSNWGAHGPVVDHNHTTEAIRGILCHKCNVAAGHLNENPVLAARLSEYLKDNRQVAGSIPAGTT